MTVKRKNIILVIAVICFGLLIAGGTYAYMTFSTNVNDGSYNTDTLCFDITYDAGGAITGTLFQSSTPQGGLMGTVSLGISPGCNIAANGTIKLNVSEDTDRILLSEGALKYAVYENLDEEPVSEGSINSTGDIVLYKDFTLPRLSYSKEGKLYNIYIWLDGEIADNDYANVSFNANIYAKATQTNDCVITYYGCKDNQLWTQTITEGESISMPSYVSTGCSTFTDEDYKCYDIGNGLHVLKCGTILWGSNALCEA